MYLKEACIEQRVNESPLKRTWARSTDDEHVPPHRYFSVYNIGKWTHHSSECTSARKKQSELQIRGSSKYFSSSFLLLIEMRLETQQLLDLQYVYGPTCSSRVYLFRFEYASKVIHNISPLLNDWKVKAVKRKLWLILFFELWLKVLKCNYVSISFNLILRICAK